MSGITIRYRANFAGFRQQPLRRDVAPGDIHDMPSETARFLALGHAVEQAVANGELASNAEAARQLGITAARLSQIVQLTLLAPDIQERVLMGQLLLSTRALRPIAQIPNWAEQRRALVAHPQNRWSNT